MSTKLCPAQQRALDALIQAAAVENALVLLAPPGMGTTTVAREVLAKFGGALLNMKDLVDAMQERHPLALEDVFEQRVLGALHANDWVVVDDVHLVLGLAFAGGSYPRPRYLNLPLAALTAYAVEGGKKLILAGQPAELGDVSHRCHEVTIGDFTPSDYEHLCHAYLPPALAAQLDYARIHRSAPMLNARQLRTACAWASGNPDLNTDGFIDTLQSRQMGSNVDLREVEAASFSDLKGVDDVLQSLETHVLLPLEHDSLVAEFGLKTTRGVLLAGAPGTGKTTIGRALAHRLRSKFFLVDGTRVAGTGPFGSQLPGIFDAARRNAPSVVFIDDSDALFANGAESGSYSYLLARLDGLESRSAGRVCVILTAMDVANLPPALVRSGRIELWLELRLPDEAARVTILRQELADVPASIGRVDILRLASATGNFSAADLKRVAADGKALFAFDRALNRSMRPSTEYFLEAVETVRSNKQRYAAAEARARSQRPHRPAYFDLFSGAEPADY
jgi:AAA+ superfamily predicted ATPase